MHDAFLTMQRNQSNCIKAQIDGTRIGWWKNEHGDIMGIEVLGGGGK